MGTFRGVFSSLGAGLSLVVAGVVVLSLFSAVIAVGGLPRAEPERTAADIALAQPPAAGSSEERRLAVRLGVGPVDRSRPASRSRVASRRDASPPPRSGRRAAPPGTRRPSARTPGARRTPAVTTAAGAPPSSTAPAGAAPSSGGAVRIPRVQSAPASDAVVDAVNGAIGTVLPVPEGRATKPVAGAAAPVTDAVDEAAGAAVGTVDSTVGAAGSVLPSP